MISRGSQVRMIDCLVSSFAVKSRLVVMGVDVADNGPHLVQLMLAYAVLAYSFVSIVVIIICRVLH